MATSMLYNLLSSMIQTDAWLASRLSSNTSTSAIEYIPLSSIGIANGVAKLDSTGKVPSSMLPANTGIDFDAVPLSAVGIANGVAPLDPTGKVPSSMLPELPNSGSDIIDFSTAPELTQSDLGKIYRYIGSGSDYISKRLYLSREKTSNSRIIIDRETLTDIFINIFQSMPESDELGQEMIEKISNEQAMMYSGTYEYAGTYTGPDDNEYPVFIAENIIEGIIFHPFFVALRTSDSNNISLAIISDVADSGSGALTKQDILNGVSSHVFDNGSWYTDEDLLIANEYKVVITYFGSAYGSNFTTIPTISDLTKSALDAENWAMGDTLVDIPFTVEPAGTSYVLDIITTSGDVVIPSQPSSQPSQPTQMFNGISAINVYNNPLTVNDGTVEMPLANTGDGSTYGLVKTVSAINAMTTDNAYVPTVYAVNSMLSSKQDKIDSSHTLDGAYITSNTIPSSAIQNTITAKWNNGATLTGVILVSGSSQLSKSNGVITIPSGTTSQWGLVKTASSITNTATTVPTTQAVYNALSAYVSGVILVSGSQITKTNKVVTIPSGTTSQWGLVKTATSITNDATTVPTTQAIYNEFNGKKFILSIDVSSHTFYSDDVGKIYMHTGNNDYGYDNNHLYIIEENDTTTKPNKLLTLFNRIEENSGGYLAVYPGKCYKIDLTSDLSADIKDGIQGYTAEAELYIRKNSFHIDDINGRLNVNPDVVIPSGNTFVHCIVKWYGAYSNFDLIVLDKDVSSSGGSEPNDSQIKLQIGSGSETNAFTLNQSTSGKITIPAASTSTQGVVQLASTITNDSNKVPTNAAIYTAIGNIETLLNALL